MRPAAFCLLMTCLASCGLLYDPYSPENIHNTVMPHPNHPGLYWVMFDTETVVNKYGNGIDEMEAALDRVEQRENRESVWHGYVDPALLKYLKANALVPNECDHGITIVNSGEQEYGVTGTAAFRCR